MKAQCLSVTHLAYIKRSDLIEAFHEFPEDYVKKKNNMMFHLYYFIQGKVLLC